MKVSTLHKQVQQQFKDNKIETPELDARILILHHTELEHSDLITGGCPVTAEQLAAIQQSVERRLRGEPIFRILGEREFWELDFKVTPDTLDPRPDTEILVEMALVWLEKSGAIANKTPVRLLDLGTGTGCILISIIQELRHKYGIEAFGVGVDFSHKAALIASENVHRHNLQDCVFVIQGDWMNAVKEESFDLIVSNPPYIPNPDIENLSKEVQNHDPILALSGGNDGLDAYKKIIFQLKKQLNQNNRAFLEIGIGQKNDIARLVDESNLCLCDSGADLAGIPRVVEICRGDK